MSITALYFHEDDYLGFEHLAIAPDIFAGYSRSFFCEACGRVYGKRVITVLGRKQPYTTWGGLCKDCSPVGGVWRGCFAHSIPGGFPFFYQYLNPPEGVIRHQLEMELNCYAQSNQAIPTLHPSRSQCLTNGTIGHRQDSLHRHIG